MIIVIYNKQLDEFINECIIENKKKKIVGVLADGEDQARV